MGQPIIRRLVLALLGATAIAFLIPFLSFLRYWLLGSRPLSVSTDVLVEWAFPVAALLAVGTVLGLTDNAAGWIVALVAALPVAAINASLSHWSLGAVAKGGLWLLLASTAGLVAGRVKRRVHSLVEARAAEPDRGT